MATGTTQREAIEQRLVELGLAGTIPNTRQQNLSSIQKLLAGNVFYTFNVRKVIEAVNEGLLDEPGVLSLMAKECGCDSVDHFLGERGYIHPRAAYDGLSKAARLIADVIRRKGTVAFGTGHPGSMTSAYNALADYMQAQGCTVVRGPVGEPVGIDWYLDYLGSVAVTSDFCGILHGHSTRPMELVIDTHPDLDLVIGDHGHAAAGINAEIPTIGIMDTNDPALAVASHLEVDDLVVVPLYDNRANAVTIELATMLIQLVSAAPAEAQHPVILFDRDR